VSQAKPWAYVPTWGARHGSCPCGERGASVLEGGTDGCLSHGHHGLPEALRWARKHDVKLVLADQQLEAIQGWCDKEGVVLKEGWTVNEAMDLLDGIVGDQSDSKES
jgi:hypothetical protein